MIWARMLAYITGTVDQELLLRNEYLAAENRILRAQIKGRLLLSDAEKATLAEIAPPDAHVSLSNQALIAIPKTCSDLIFSPFGPTTTSHPLCLAIIKYALEMNIIQRRRRETLLQRTGSEL